MSLKKRGLGRGLEALLVDVSTKEEKHQLQTLPIDIFSGQSSATTYELQELANSITPGTFEPVVVRKIPKTTMRCR